MRGLGVGQLEDDGELVATDPAEQIGGPQLTRPTRACGLKQPVSGRVALAVVDLLEAVQVEHQDAQRLQRPARAGQRAVELLVPVATIRQPCQLIGDSLVGELGDQLGANERRADHRPEQGEQL